MKKFNKFIKSFLFISLWLIVTSYLQKYWNTFHWEYIYLNLRTIFDKEFWFVLERYLFGIDLGYWIEELLKFLSLYSKLMSPLTSQSSTPTFVILISTT